jgi:alpha-glucosidase
MEQSLAKKNQSSFSSPILNPGSINGVERTSLGLIGTTEKANFSIQFYNEHIVRVRFSRSAFTPDLNYAVVAQPESGLQDFADEEEWFVLTGTHYSVHVSKATAEVRFVDPKGEVINQDEPGLGTSWNGEQVTTYKTLQPGERFIGLGEKTGPLDRRGKGYQHWNTDAFAYGPGSDPIYSTIPFYLGVHSGLVYGIFFDNSAKSFFNFGASNNRTSSFYADTGEMNYYFLHGKSIPEILSAYSWLTGNMPLPPLWSLGFQQCRYSYYPDQEVINLADKFRQKEIPADAVVLDIHYMDAYKIFTWHPEYFPHPEKMIHDLASKNFKVVVMCDPGIKAEEGYQAYDEGLRENLFLNYPDGQPYTGQVWPGWCHMPDFTNPKTRDYWRKWMKSYADSGVRGFWNDMNEFSSWGQMMPENILFDFEGQMRTSREGRNVYGLKMCEASYDGAKEHLQGKRPFILTRSGYAGVQRYAALWTGDNVAYDEHMLLGVRLVSSLGLSGVPFSGYDIGGFVGEASPKLFARWISIGALSPFCRVHSMINSRSSEPWSYGEEVEMIARNYLRLRYQLLPYVYSLFHEASVTGMPVQRTLAIEWPHQDEVYSGAFENQYLFGPSILVAACDSTKELVKVYLPEGGWYALYDGKYFEGQQILATDSPVHRLPVYVRAGSVLIMQDPVQSTEQKSETVHLHIYPGKEGSSFEWYMDDGETYGYQSGACVTRTLHSENGKVTLSASNGNFVPAWKHIRVVLHGVSDGGSMMCNGKHVKTETIQHSYFLPMLKFDPLESAPDVGSESVQQFVIPYTPDEVVIAFPPI